MTTDTSPAVSPVMTGMKIQVTQQLVNTLPTEQTKVPVTAMTYPSMYPIAGNYSPAYFTSGEEVVVTSPYGSIARVSWRYTISNAWYSHMLVFSIQ